MRIQCSQYVNMTSHFQLGEQDKKTKTRNLKGSKRDSSANRNLLTYSSAPQTNNISKQKPVSEYRAQLSQQISREPE